MVPTSYYDTLLDRVQPIDEDLSVLSELGVLVDRDDEGYLLQLFTKPVERPRRSSLKSSSAKAQLIQAKVSYYRALFEAIKHKQPARQSVTTESKVKNAGARLFAPVFFIPTKLSSGLWKTTHEHGV